MYSFGKICHSVVIPATTAITHVIHLNLVSAYRQKKEVVCVNVHVYMLLQICLGVYSITIRVFSFLFDVCVRDYTFVTYECTRHVIYAPRYLLPCDVSSKFIT